MDIIFFEGSLLEIYKYIYSDLFNVNKQGCVKS